MTQQMKHKFVGTYMQFKATHYFDLSTYLQTMERKKNDSNSFMNTHYFETICNGEKM
jgi:hypothetical protein